MRRFIKKITAFVIVIPIVMIAYSVIIAAQVSNDLPSYKLLTQRCNKSYGVVVFDLKEPYAGKILSDLKFATDGSWIACSDMKSEMKIIPLSDTILCIDDVVYTYEKKMNSTMNGIIGIRDKNGNIKTGCTKKGHE